MKRVLVICESGYWGDLKDGLARVGCEFLGYDNKKPNRRQIEQLVAQADFVVMRNQNVAHHSVRFAKEAAKMTDIPFWISSNFGLQTIIIKLNQAFPEEKFELPEATNKTRKKRRIPSSKPSTGFPKSATAKESHKYLKNKKPHLPLKNALKDVKIDNEIDFTQLF